MVHIAMSIFMTTRIKQIRLVQIGRRAGRENFHIHGVHLMKLFEKASFQSEKFR